MPMKRVPIILAASALLMASCLSKSELEADVHQRKVDFDVVVTRDGRLLTRSGVSAEGVDQGLTILDGNNPFGLIAVDSEDGRLMIDNASVYGNGDGTWTGYFDDYGWPETSRLSIGAYYPYVNSVSYGDENKTYSIHYTADETDAGPLVSKTVESAISVMKMVPLVFQHVSNDIGFKICDATPSQDLQGLVHIRKLIAHNIAKAGVYVDTLATGGGRWKLQGQMTDIVVFDGDAKVPSGTSNELFVGRDRLSDSYSESNRFYSVPDEIKMGKQFVEIVYDVEGFTHNDFYYEPLKGVSAKYLIYGLLPENQFRYGKQYTFHIGIDLSAVYPEITFSPTVGGWETRIYENHEDF